MAVVFHRVKLFLSFTIVMAFASSLYAADDDTTFTRGTRDLGLYIGSSYSLMKMDASAYFVGSNTGKPELKNSLGLYAGLCYNLYAGNRLVVRPAIEAFFLPIKIAYQTASNIVTEQNVLPMTLEFPISIIYSSFRIKAASNSMAKPEVGFAIRPVIGVKPLIDSQPVLKSRNINSDLIFGYPIAGRKSVLRLEAFYSHGWFNLIGSDEDYRTKNIISLYRHSAGIRFIFH